MLCVRCMGTKVNKILKYLSVSLFTIATQYVYAECDTYATPAVLGPVSSFNVPNLSAQQMSGGLSCVGTLTLVSTSFIKYRPLNVPATLLHQDGVNKARIVIRDNNNNILQTGVERDLSSFSLISLFGGPNSSIPFSVTVTESTNLKPGVYQGNLRIKWFYYVGAFGIGGIHLWAFVSPGLQYSWLWGLTDWGTGLDANVPIVLTVTEDCRINASDISFGSAALVSKFDTVNGVVQITCSAQTPYSVGLSNGQNFNATRRMKHQSQSNYIGYEVYKNVTQQRWGSIGSERWNSNEASVNPLIYDGITNQNFSYTAKITEPSTVIAPEGVYTDTLQIEVKF